MDYCRRLMPASRLRLSICRTRAGNKRAPAGIPPRRRPRFAERLLGGGFRGVSARRQHIRRLDGAHRSRPTVGRGSTDAAFQRRRFPALGFELGGKMADEFDNAAGPQFRVTEAVREAVPALIGLWGYSDSGKTYSALRLARGLAGPKGKIVVIDTENKRAKLYAGLFGGWSHIDLQPPFTPDRYMAAHRAALEAGAKAVVIDSMS